MEDLCRICGGHSKSLVGIFDEQERQNFEGGGEPNLAEMVRTCADVQLDPEDSLPQKICIACVHDARTAYGFKRRCEESYRKFYSALSKHKIVKEEPNEDYLVIEELFDGDLEAKEEFIEETPPSTPAKEDSPIIAAKKNKPKVTSRASRQPKARRNLPIKCELCIKEFKHPRNLLEHMKVHSNSHVCQNCGERFLFKADLDKHVCYHTSDSTVECRVCLKVFSNTQSLDKHKCQEMKERIFQCPHCPQTFTQEQQLQAHLLSHPDSSQSNGPHKCSYCDAGFFNKSALQVHIHAHMGERPHSCPFCASNFRSKQALKVHIRTHTGEKPYKCPHCQKSFSDNNNLAKHRRRHTDERPYKCSICLQEFREKHHLKRHFLGKHRDGDQQLELE
ncbi:zinc finger protein Paris [Drosophila takahashii]|uniref:zinc finger protein Paris n=1 Tax=Drosophila takahashii TaxID=29030 RepID=UPI001CF8E1C8|nr:zinc finger protein OZF [Drosophila takahashii]